MGSYVCFSEKVGCCSILDFSDCGSRQALLACTSQAGKARVQCNNSCHCSNSIPAKISACQLDCGASHKAAKQECRNAYDPDADSPGCAKIVSQDGEHC